jgi:hypothetical protein
MSPTGIKTKNDCAGEGQQQFTGLDWSELFENQQLRQLVVRSDMVASRQRHMYDSRRVSIAENYNRASSSAV